jgi:hypothetical protein
MKFRKKPIIIEAEQWFPGVDIPEVNYPVCAVGYPGISVFDSVATINTLEGTMFVSPGDWIIKGVNGEFYPCKPDIFEKTYEKVDD